MILTFTDDEAAIIFDGGTSRKLPSDIQRTALRKLNYVHSALTLADLRIPPQNRLEKLHGDREGQWSIRVNDQWRICFRWEAGNAFDVQITDYH